MVMPSASASLGPCSVTGVPLPHDLAAVWRPQSRDGLDQRGLARAVVADESGDLTGRNVKINRGQGADRAEGLGHLLQRQQRPAVLGCGRGRRAVWGSAHSVAVLGIAPARRDRRAGTLHRCVL